MVVCHIEVVAYFYAHVLRADISVEVSLVALPRLEKGFLHGENLYSNTSHELALARQWGTIVQRALFLQGGTRGEVTNREVGSNSLNHELEGRYAGVPMRLTVVCQRQDVEQFVPALGVFSDIVTEFRRHDTVVPFNLTIGLWVVRRRTHSLDTGHLHDCDEKVQHELGSLVGQDAVGWTVARDQMVNDGRRH